MFLQCVQFHPNSNYIATGSSDRTVRLWDNVTGTQVRLMTGHKGQIYSLAFSVEGRFLASAGSDFKIMLWDLAHGHLLASLSGHSSTIYALCFSRDGNLLTSGTIETFSNSPCFYRHGIIIFFFLHFRFFRLHCKNLGFYKIGGRN